MIYLQYLHLLQYLIIMNNNLIVPKDQPTTTAKVIMTTTNGQLQIELWAKQIPLACRNFIQLALQGYYEGTIFHRLIPGFMIQGGDPSGTGTGGQSIYGVPFKDQFHQRLKFGRRGMLAMANSGSNTNNSQFFITFAQCPHLNKKHTIFGKVVGDSMYNLLEFQSLQTDQNDRPNYPPSIKKIKVVLNPFDDIIPRNIQKNKEEEQKKQQKTAQQQKKQTKSQIKKLKNKNKLTFDEQQPQNQPNYKIKSSHDTLNDGKLSKKVAITQEQLQKKRKQKQEQKQRKKQISKKINQALVVHNQDEGLESMLKSELLKKRRNAELNQPEQKQLQDQVLNYQKKVNPETGKIQLVWGQQNQGRNNEGNQGDESKMQRLRDLQQQQYQALRSDQLNFKKLKQGSAKQRRKQLVAEQKTLLSNVQKKKYQFLKKSMTEKRQGQVLSKLNKFTQRLKEDKPNDWMCHSLKFHIDSQNAFSLDKKNQERKVLDDDDDGGLKVDYGKYQPIDEQIDLQQLYNLAKDDSDQ